MRACPSRDRCQARCQYQTNSGRMCQSWTEQTPQSHGYIPDWFPDAHLGDHNFCRNPDGDSTIWCASSKYLGYCLFFASRIEQFEQARAVASVGLIRTDSLFFSMVERLHLTRLRQKQDTFSKQSNLFSSTDTHLAEG